MTRRTNAGDVSRVVNPAVRPALGMMRLEFKFRNRMDHLRRGVIVVAAAAIILPEQPNWSTAGLEGRSRFGAFHRYDKWRKFPVSIVMGSNMDHGAGIGAGAFELPDAP